MICGGCQQKIENYYTQCPTCDLYLYPDNPWGLKKVIPFVLVITLVYGALVSGFIYTSETFAKYFADPITILIPGFAIWALYLIKFHVAQTKYQLATLEHLQTIQKDFKGGSLIQAFTATCSVAMVKKLSASIPFQRLLWFEAYLKTCSNQKADALHGMQEHFQSDWDSLESSTSSIQYYVWFLPTAGFLGTVYGMTQALSKFSGALTNDLAFESSLIETTKGLSVAFNSTFIGLLAVIPVLFYATYAKRLARTLIERSDRYFAFLLANPPKLEQTDSEEDVDKDRTMEFTYPKPPPVRQQLNEEANVAAQANLPNLSKEDHEAETEYLFRDSSEETESKPIERPEE
ncbi:MAG: MotA/TolQ/ExbB proton channel family protein [Lentisphaeria bacterium]|nr:MotA/TolQ/ExbB proton channel family protein [Lentisphaeria bacterium]